MDAALFQALKRWARRRHPDRTPGWVLRKYFHSVRTANWVFCGQVDGQVHHLLKAASIPIRRYVKIQSRASPFDPAWGIYFEQRLGIAMADSLQGRRQILFLRQEHYGICPICQQKITQVTGWHNHHRIWRSKGGPDSADNRVLVHPTCHQWIHGLGL